MEFPRGELTVTLGKGICKAPVEKRRDESTRDARREAAGIAKRLHKCVR